MIEKKSCTGCGLCAEVCPKNCITMVADEEGFLYPRIDDSKCINCNLCEKRCPHNNDFTSKDSPDYYCAINGDAEDLLKSSSGGMFIAFAKMILDKGGIVCGCVYDEDMVAKHICTDELEIVYKMCGSKYVQSRAYDTYPEIEKYLLMERKVLFTGTGCQVAALKGYLGKEYNELLTIDILCHGVPSPEFFRKYVEHLEKKYKGQVTDIQFRNKEKRGWGSEHRTCIFINKNGKQRKVRPFLPAYCCAFFWGINLRPSCYQCKYAGEKRVSDITIGDYWGYWKKYKKNFYEGISIASINTTKGKEGFEKQISEFTFVEKLPSNEAKGSNTNFYNPTKCPLNRDMFYKNLKEIDYYELVKHTFIDKTCRRRLIVSLYGKIVPNKIMRLIRYLRRL